MTDWTDGYTADIDYTYGCYPELNPLYARMVFLNAGLEPPTLGTHCELGFGQGLNVNFQAAATASVWHGTDFNPSHASFARTLASYSGAAADLRDQSFEEFCGRADLPEFDSIGLHGIWSWVSDENRTFIVDFIRRKLKVGGLLYVSYNTLPGWSAFAPVRHLMAQHARAMSAPGTGAVRRVDEALEFAHLLLESKPRFALANPSVTERLEKAKGQDRHYLAHEYFNANWEPMYFSAMASWLAPAKVEYACSANYLSNVYALNYSAEQQKFIGQLPDPILRQTVMDFMVNQQFRKDYWVKGPRRLSPRAQGAALRAQSVLLLTPPIDISLDTDAAVGKVQLQEATYGPVLDALADHKPKTMSQLEGAVRGQGVSFSQLHEVVLILTGMGHMAPAQDEEKALQAKQHTERLNANLMERACADKNINFLASPVTGGGTPVGRFEQIFLLAMSKGHIQSSDLASFAWDILVSVDERILKDGKALQSTEDNVQELTAMANSFIDKRLPVLKALQIA